MGETRRIRAERVGTDGKRSSGLRRTERSRAASTLTMGKDCSRNFVRVLAVVLLTVWTLCTMTSGHILGKSCTE